VPCPIQVGNVNVSYVVKMTAFNMAWGVVKANSRDEDDMIICEGCNMERYSDVDFTIDNAREDVLDDGDVLCDYCWASHDKYVDESR